MTGRLLPDDELSLMLPVFDIFEFLKELFVFRGFITTMFMLWFYLTSKVFLESVFGQYYVTLTPV